MVAREHLRMNSDDSSRLAADGASSPIVLYRRTSLSTHEIKRFVTVLLHELFAEREGLHYEAVHEALANSGIQPTPALKCDAFHFEQQVESNRFADAIVHEIVSDDAIRAAIIRIATSLLNRLTTPAPVAHISADELAEYVACCSGGAHIPQYDRYASSHAHVGVCTQCDVQATRMLGDCHPPATTK